MKKVGIPASINKNYLHFFAGERTFHSHCMFVISKQLVTTLICYLVAIILPHFQFQGNLCTLTKT